MCPEVEKRIFSRSLKPEIQISRKYIGFLVFQKRIAVS